MSSINLVIECLNLINAYESLLQDSNPTPYSQSWFYLPERGWLWTDRSSYPYFFDEQTSQWMFFQSGHEKPRFYHYGTEEWITMESDEDEDHAYHGDDDHEEHDEFDYHEHEEYEYEEDSHSYDPVIEDYQP